MSFCGNAESYLIYFIMVVEKYPFNVRLTEVATKLSTVTRVQATQ